MFLEISQNSQENICARASFLIKLQPLVLLIILNSITHAAYIILIRIDVILSKNIQNKFQSLLFKKLLTQSGNQTDIFWKCRHIFLQLHFGCPKPWGKCQITPLRKPSDDCFCIFHSSFFIDFCHPTNRNQVFSVLEHVLSQLSKVINMNFAFGRLHFLTTWLLLHGTMHFILGDNT